MHRLCQSLKMSRIFSHFFFYLLSYTYGFITVEFIKRKKILEVDTWSLTRIIRSNLLYFLIASESTDASVIQQHIVDKPVFFYYACASPRAFHVILPDLRIKRLLVHVLAFLYQIGDESFRRLVNSKEEKSRIAMSAIIE